MEAVQQPSVQTQKNISSSEGIGQHLVEGLERDKKLKQERMETIRNGNTPFTPSPVQTQQITDFTKNPPAPIEDVTDSFKNKLELLQKEGKTEEISKLRSEISEATKTGKKVSEELVKHLETLYPTPEEKVKALEVEKNVILNDLKLSKEQKDEAIKKLDTATAKKNFWEEDEFLTEKKEVSAEEQDGIDEDVLKGYELKAKQYDAIESDPFIKAYLSAKETGKPVTDFLSEMVKGNPANLSDADILEKRITRFGLNEEEAEEERDNFKSKSPSDRKELIAKERGLLVGDYAKNFDKYTADNSASRDKLISTAKQSIKESNDYLQSIKGKEVWGITYDSTQMEKLTEWANNTMENGLFRKDGTADVPLIMQLGMMKLNQKHMLQKAFEKGQTSQSEQFFKEYGRPSKDNGIGGKADLSMLPGVKTKREESHSFFDKQVLHKK